MTPDGINFILTKEVSLSIGHDGQVLLLVGDKWHYITETNFGQFLLESQCWGNPQPQWPETASGTIQ
jgi:hypothetical protein